MTTRFRIPHTVRWVLVLAVALLGFASAQQPLTSPSYVFGALTPVRLDKPVDGRLEPGDGQNFRDGSYVDLYRVDGVAGEPVLIEMTSSDFDSYLVLFDIDGNEVASNDDGPGGGFGDSLLETVLPADGSYLLVATSFFGGSGAYTVARVLATSRFEDAVDASFGVSEGTLGADEVRTLRVTLDAETTMRVRYASDAFDTVLTLYDENGAEVAYNDDSDDGTNSEVLATLDPGTYYLALEEFFGGVGGAYTLEIVRLQQLD